MLNPICPVPVPNKLAACPALKLLIHADDPPNPRIVWFVTPKSTVELLAGITGPVPPPPLPLDDDPPPHPANTTPTAKTTHPANRDKPNSFKGGNFLY